MLRHRKRACNGFVKMEVSNTIKVWGNPIFTPDGTKISSIQLEDVFKLDKKLKFTDLKFYCKNCQEYIDILDIEVECTHCYEFFPSDQIWVLTGTGGYYCEAGKQDFKDDISIEFIQLIDCIKLIR